MVYFHQLFNLYQYYHNTTTTTDLQELLLDGPQQVGFSLHVCVYYSQDYYLYHCTSTVKYHY